MATTPNFSWPTPDNTDLVKNGALAIRTLGDAIDASLVDLEGGTTDQVLAKNSNTDMDFKWVTSDDANAIQNAIVDAKGDLIGASANDTPAITSVGANNTSLVANSSTATGLEWQGAWTTWTPSYGAGITIGNATVISRYQIIGKNLTFHLKITLGSTTTIGAGNNFLSMPFLPSVATPIFGYYFDTGTAEVSGFCLINTSGNLELKRINTASSDGAIGNISTTTPFTWATGDYIQFAGTYEVA
jgi:hypothetical protein